MEHVDMDMSYGEFLANAPEVNPRADMIKGSICGVRVEEIEDPLAKRMRQINKMIDELSKGKPMEKILTRREQEIPHLYRWRDELR